MVKFLIIGFEYDKLEQTSRLPVIRIDIKNFFNWVRKWCSSGDIITDYKIHKIYKNLDHKYYYCQDRKDTINAIFSSLSNSKGENKYIIYFTGHGKDKGMLLPDGSIMYFHTLKKVICGMVPPQSEIFVMIDCCHPGRMGLNYVFSKTHFVFKNEENIEKSSQKFFFLTSFNYQERNIITDRGSLFTNSFLRAIKNLNRSEIDKKNIQSYIYSKNRNIERFCSKIREFMKYDVRDMKIQSGFVGQEIVFASSHNLDPILWLWIGNKNNKDYSFVKSKGRIVIH